MTSSTEEFSEIDIVPEIFSMVEAQGANGRGPRLGAEPVSVRPDTLSVRKAPFRPAAAM